MQNLWLIQANGTKMAWIERLNEDMPSVDRVGNI